VLYSSAQLEARSRLTPRPRFLALAQVVRLMQRRERLPVDEVVEHRLGHPHRRLILDTAMGHAVTEGDVRSPFEQGAPGLDNLARRGGMIEAPPSNLTASITTLKHNASGKESGVN
jgi:hypothetical protein